MSSFDECKSVAQKLRKVTEMQPSSNATLPAHCSMWNFEGPSLTCTALCTTAFLLAASGSSWQRSDMMSSLALPSNKLNGEVRTFMEQRPTVPLKLPGGMHQSQVGRLLQASRERRSFLTVGSVPEAWA